MLVIQYLSSSKQSQVYKISYDKYSHTDAAKKQWYSLAKVA